MFDYCDRLLSLDIRNNLINSVEKHCFQFLHNLKSLHLETNQIIRLTDKLFYNLNADTYLNLSYYSTTFVETRWFKHKRKLSIDNT